MPRADYYALLGIPKNATSEEIRKAYSRSNVTYKNVQVTCNDINM